MTKPGFTLIETVIYLALFGLIFSGAVTAIYDMTANQYRRAGQLDEINDLIFINGKLRQVVRGAASVYSTGPSLVATSPNGETIVLETANGQLMLRRGSAEALPLNGPALQITDTSFAVTPETVIVDLILSEKTMTLVASRRP